LTIEDSKDLVITPDDLMAGEPLDRPGGQARAAVGRPGQRGYQPAVPATPDVTGPVALQFIARCSLSMLEDPSSRNSPLTAWAIIAGVLGPCFTHSSREDAFSSSILGAEALRRVCHLFVGESDLSIVTLVTSLPRLFTESARGW
jgi:hypothetical protein